MKRRRKTRQQPSEPYVQSLVVRDPATGLQEVHVCIGTNDIERLRCAALEAFESTLARHLPNPEFGGQIVLVILSDMTLQSVEVWAATAALEDQLRGILDRHPLQTVTGQAVGVRIQYTSRQEP